MKATSVKNIIILGCAGIAEKQLSEMQTVHSIPFIDFGLRNSPYGVKWPNDAIFLRPNRCNSLTDDVYKNLHTIIIDNKSLATPVRLMLQCHCAVRRIHRTIEQIAL